MNTLCVYSGPSGMRIEQETADLRSCMGTKLRKLRREIAAAAALAPSKTTARLLADIDAFQDGCMKATLSTLIFEVSEDEDGFYIFKADQSHWSIRFYSDHNSEYMSGEQPTDKLLMRMERDEKRAKRVFNYENTGK